MPLFWFPRQCPRCTYWVSPRTKDDDVARFLDGRRDLRVHVIEAGWYERVRSGQLFIYRMPQATFAEHPEVAGYWRSRAPVEPIERQMIDGLVDRHHDAGIPLRSEQNLWPLWDEVVASTLEFSGIRLRHALPRPEAPV